MDGAVLEVLHLDGHNCLELVLLVHAQVVHEVAIVQALPASLVAAGGVGQLGGQRRVQRVRQEDELELNFLLELYADGVGLLEQSGLAPQLILGKWISNKKLAQVRKHPLK